MSAPAKDVRDILVAAGVGQVGGSAAWGIFYPNEPDAPTEAITLRDTGGRDPEYLLDDSTLAYPLVQVRVRAQDYDTGYAKAKEIEAALGGRAPETVNGTPYAGFWQTGATNHIGADAQERPLFTLNFRLVREE
jgi:hypothetical protein